jgi:ABC-2 type transport system ATP-binding protein
VEVHVLGDAVARAEALPFIGKRNILGGKAFIFEDIAVGEVAGLGELRTPTLTDLFVAKVGG